MHPLMLGDLPAWGSSLLAAIGTAVPIGGFFTWLMSRADKRRQEQREDAQKAESGNAEVKKAQIDSDSKLDEQYRKEFHRFREEANLRIMNLENALGDMREMMDLLRAKYVDLYVYAQKLQDRNTALLQIVKHDRPDFNPSEYPPIDLTALSPTELFTKPHGHPTNITVTVPQEPKKTTVMFLPTKDT